MYHKPYERLKFYQDICQIRDLIAKSTKIFEKGNLKLVSQMRDAARSAKQNIREGYLKGTLNEFLHSIRISQGSLEELAGDMDDCLKDGNIPQETYDEFKNLYRSATYLSTRYLRKMSQDQMKQKWKRPFSKDS